jgi:acetate kinase
MLNEEGIKNTEMKILVINSGSSSIKYKLYESTVGNGDFGVLAQGSAERIGISGSSVDCKRDGQERSMPFSNCSLLPEKTR